MEKPCTWLCANSFVWTDTSSAGRGFSGVGSFLFFSPQPEWQTVRRASELRARSALTCSCRSMSVNQASPSARIRNKFHILRKQLWFGLLWKLIPGLTSSTHTFFSGWWGPAMGSNYCWLPADSLIPEWVRAGLILGHSLGKLYPRTHLKPLTNCWLLSGK